MFDTVITIVGNALNTPERRRLEGSQVMVSRFKVAATSRRYDRQSGRWVDGASLRVRVNCWRRLAENVSASVLSGDPVIVTGRMYTRDWIGDDGQRRISYELDAIAVGHDLARGQARFERNRHSLRTTVVGDEQTETWVNGQPTEPVTAVPGGGEAADTIGGSDGARATGSDDGAGGGNDAADGARGGAAGSDWDAAAGADRMAGGGWDDAAAGADRMAGGGWDDAAAGADRMAGGGWDDAAAGADRMAGGWGDAAGGGEHDTESAAAPDGEHDAEFDAACGGERAAEYDDADVASLSAYAARTVNQRLGGMPIAAGVAG